jgi:putative flippase GtrA
LIAQFSRFFVVGLVNTAIDYSILFSLSFLTGITKGNEIIPLNIVSFGIATTNSYFLNKYWAFKDLSHFHQGRKVSLFLLVSLTAVVLNTTIVRLITTNIDPLFGFTASEWLLVAKVIATGISLFWNFAGYKWIVFKK